MIHFTPFEMVPVHRIWVFFLLACLTSDASGKDFVPLARRAPLPSEFQNRPVWAAAILENGEIFASLEGTLLIGNPSGAWKTLRPPPGPPVHLVQSGHGKLLLVSTTAVFIYDKEVLSPVVMPTGRIYSAETCPEGWLCAGEPGLVLVHSDGTTQLVRPHTAKSRITHLSRSGTAILVCDETPLVQVWSNGVLANFALPEPLKGLPLFSTEDGLYYTYKGLFSSNGELALSREVMDATFQNNGVFGMFRSDEHILFATLTDGIVAMKPLSDAPDYRWRELGGCYFVGRYRSEIILGTSEGLFTLANPAQMLVRPLSGVDFYRIQSSERGVHLVRYGQGELIVGTPLRERETFPGTSEIYATEGNLYFKKQAVTLSYVPGPCFGIATAGDSAAFCFRDSLEILDGTTRKHIELKQDFSRLESDSKNFFVSTTANGVHVFSPAGEMVETIGSGQARVRSLSDGRVLLLFSNGQIRDSSGKLLATCTDGVPMDAALINGKMAFMVTRYDGPPVVRQFEQGRWLSMEVQGLASVIAESMVTYKDKLYIAGRRGVLQVNLPLAPSSPPEPTYRWSAPVMDDRVMIPDDSESIATLIAGMWEPELEPTTSVRVRVDGGQWSGVQPGAELPITVGWGQTKVEIVAERNLLRSERTFTVIRPYPWWLRSWAWPIHAAVLALMIWLGVRWRTHQLEARARELETRVGERTTALVRGNAMKEEFLATIGHEIRNPLNGLVGIAMILQDSEVGPREKSFVRALAGCADQLRAIMDDVTEYSRADRGQVLLSPTPFDLVSLVEQCARVMDPTLGSCSLLQPEGPVWLLGDSGKIRQILCNLIGNALKYGQPREAGIEVRLQPGASPEHTYVRISVRNTGPTIPPAELPHLFEPFRRGSNTTEIKGSGLGLTVSRKLAVAMSGTLNAYSGNGSTEFVFEVSLARSHEPAKIPVLEKPVSRALAIEDEDYNRLVLGHVLRELGYEVDWAPDGMSALRLASRQTYDLIVTDWKLPDLAGDELCRRLQKVLGEPRPPIVAVTAYTAGEKFDAARAAGMAGFLTKPVTREKLEHLIRRLAEGLNPRAPVDIQRPAPSEPTFAQLGNLGPSMEKLAIDIVMRWADAKAQAELRDPRTSRTAHALRSLLLLAGEADVAEQLGLLETNAAEGDWDTVEQLLPFLSEEIASVRDRLKLS